MSLTFPLVAFILSFFFGRYLGRQFALFSTTVLAFCSFITCLYFFLQVFFEGNVYVIDLGTWIVIGSLEVSYKLVIDPLSITFGTLISFITLLILIYSYDYLYEDPHLVKFFAYLSFFSFSMSCLVFSGNYFILFLGWEAVGLASYLLINFWSTRNQANQAAMKAIIFNRIGDIMLITAIGLMSYMFNSFDFEELELFIPAYSLTTIDLFSFSFSITELIACFLFLAAAAKSAQLFLHPWLPDAMEGPTPVSALLHSATMVTAGVFLLLRSSTIFSHAPMISLLVACIGLITANLSSLTGIMQYDIKRIIAFSTCSQLGFMMFAAGLGNYTYALYHLVNHAFFKALLFLCAGSIIHAIGDQDIRRMGALFKALPITYSAMLLASLSLIGFPFLSGFYSKDFLLEATYNVFGSFSYVVYLISAISTSISSFYSFRLLYYVFFADMVASKKTLQTVSESSYFLYIPIIILTLLSVFSGYFLKDLMTVHTPFYNFMVSPLSDVAIDQDFFSDLFKVLPSIFSLFGLILVYYICSQRKLQYQQIYRYYLLSAYLSCKRFFADAFNSLYIFLPSASFSLNITYKTIDQGLLEFLGATGNYNFFESLFKALTQIEATVFIYRLLLFVIFALTTLLSLSFIKATYLLILLISVPFFIYTLPRYTRP